MTGSELQSHLDWKASRLAALGNAASDTSLEYIISYINSSDAHVLLRTCAVNALGRFDQPEVSRSRGGGDGGGSGGVGGGCVWVLVIEVMMMMMMVVVVVVVVCGC